MQFKKLMNKLDPFEEGEEGSDQEPAQQTTKDEPLQQNMEVLAQQRQEDSTQTKVCVFMKYIHLHYYVN